MWQSGRPPVVDSAGFVYLFTGNGYTNGYNGTDAFGESALKLDPANGLALIDWFTPANWSALDSADKDLSSSGPMLVPNTGLLAGGGKDGTFFLLNERQPGPQQRSAIPGALQKSDVRLVSRRPGLLAALRGQRRAACSTTGVANDTAKAYAFNGSTFASHAELPGQRRAGLPGRHPGAVRAR